MKESGRYRLIEAGRGAACLWVLLFHGLDGFPPGTLPVPLALLQVPAHWGWMGVYVFFAISGWCIAERLAAGRAQAEPAGHFLAERWLRIYPVYWAALAFAVGAVLLTAEVKAVAAAPFLPRHLAGWVGAGLLIEPYLGQPSYLMVSWTLVYELGFYLCAAVALLVAQRRWSGGRALFLLGAVLCFAPWTAGAGHAPWRVLSYWPDFFAGTAAWWAVRRGHTLAGFGLLAAMAAGGLLYPGYASAPRWTAIGTAMALAVLHRWDARLAGLPPARFLMWVGGFSYSLYLIHERLIIRLLNLGKPFMPTASAAYLGWWGASIAICLGSGWLLHRWVEAPVERWRRTVGWFRRERRAA